jgi:hypothetical protein
MSGLKGLMTILLWCWSRNRSIFCFALSNQQHESILCNLFFSLLFEEKKLENFIIEKEHELKKVQKINQKYAFYFSAYNLSLTRNTHYDTFDEKKKKKH